MTSIRVYSGDISGKLADVAYFPYVTYTFDDAPSTTSSSVAFSALTTNTLITISFNGLTLSSQALKLENVSTLKYTFMPK